MITAGNINSKNLSAISANDSFELGSVVEVDYKGRGMYWRGKIVCLRLNDTYDIDYDNGTHETGVCRDLIKLSRPQSRDHSLNVNFMSYSQDRGRHASDKERSVSRNLIKIKARYV
jgi:hypothetical protein